MAVKMHNTVYEIAIDTRTHQLKTQDSVEFSPAAFRREVWRILNGERLAYSWFLPQS